MGKRLDLAGQRFGKLIVLSPSKDIGGQTTWLCRCDCGQETIVRTSKLRSGSTRSCGCQRRTAAVKVVKARKDNTSGVSGVEWLPHKQQWKATISFNRKCYYLGTYTEFEEAVNVREQAEEARKRAEEHLRNNFLREFVGAMS